MKKIFLAVAVLLSFTAQAQNTGEIVGKTENGVRRAVSIDSLTANRFALMIHDSILGAKIPTGLTVNSNRLAIYSPDSLRVHIPGTVTVTPTGTWNINNISGTISLPTGAATETTLSAINTKIPSNLTVNSNRLAIYSPDSIRVFATNGFGSGGGGGTSLDAVDSANLAAIKIAATIPDASLHSDFGGTKMLGRVTTGSLPSYTNDRLATPLLDDHGFMYTRNYGGEVSVFLPDRTPGDLVGHSYDTLGQLRVTDTLNTFYMQDIAGVLGFFLDEYVTYPETSNEYLRQIRDTTASMDQELSGASAKLTTISNKDSVTMSRKGVVLLQDPILGANSGVDIGDVTINNASGGGAVNIQDGGNSITVDGTVAVSGHDSTTDSRKGVVLLNDSIRVFATNGFGGGSSGSTSLDVVDSTNLAKAADSNAQRKGVVIVGGSITATAGATAIYDSTWTAVAMDTAGLGAKANSATVGWQSDTVGIRQHKVTDMKLGVKISFANTAPANDKACYIYAVPWWYDGTNWYAGSQGTTTLPTGANGTTTIASPNDLVLLGVLSYTTQNQVCQRQFNLSNVFGNTLPDAVSFVIINSTGAAIHTSGNLLYYSLVNKTQR